MKKELRKRFLKVRNGFSSEYVENISEKILEKLEQLSIFQEAQAVFIYVHFGTEIITTKLIEKYLHKKKIYVPKIVGTDMKLVEIKSLTELKKGYFDILEPISNSFYEGKVDLVVTPSVVFAKDGYRIGYGKGYYDKYFSKKMYKNSIGLSYHKLLQDKVPTDKYDIKVDYVLTEEELIVAKSFIVNE